MKGLKKLLSYGLVVGLSLSLVGCGSSGDSKDEAKGEGAKTKLEQIKDNGKLVVGTSAEYPPYEFHKMIDGEDTIVGFDIMIAEEIAEEIGVEIELKDMEFDSLIGALNADKVDVVLSGMTPTEDRKKSVDFSEVYHIEENDLIVSKGKEEIIKTEEDLKDYKIGVQKGSIQEKFVTQTVGCTDVKSLPKIPDLILELQNGNIDAILVSSNVAHINVGRYDEIAIANSEVGDDISEGAAVAFKKSEDNKDLIELVDNKLKELEEADKIKEFVDEARKLAQ